MNEHLVPKIINLCVVKLSNSRAKAGPMSEAIALGLTRVPRLVLDYFESQADSSRPNQRFTSENTNLKPDITLSPRLPV
jgi:hypothetical protein